MGMMLPNELIWIMDKLDYSWPDLDEEDLFAAGRLTNTLRDELEEIIRRADEQVTLEVRNAATGKAADAYAAAWETNRDQHLNQLLDVLFPVQIGLDGGAGVVVALKTKVIIQVTLDLAAMVPLIMAGPLGAAGFIAKKAASKMIMNLMVEYAVGELINWLTPKVIEPLADEIPGLMQKLLGADQVEDTGSDRGELKMDTAGMERVLGVIGDCEVAMGTAIGEYMTSIRNLTFTS